MRIREPQQIELEGEVVGEEDAFGEAPPSYVTALSRRDRPGLPVLSYGARNAMLAVAGGAVAGVVTVAAVRALGPGARRPNRARRRFGPRRRDESVVASRSFLVDVHVLGR